MIRTQQNRFFLLLVRATLGLAATSLLFQFWSRPALAVFPSGTELQAQEPIKRQLSYAYDPPPVIKIKRISKVNTAEFPNDFEVDIQNIGEKPIYYMQWYLRLPEVEVGGSDLAFSIDCGNPTLLELKKTPNPDDEPIKPGESYTIKIAAKQLNNFTKFMQKLAVTRGGPIEITKVELSLFLINFGDGTGYIMGSQTVEPSSRQPANKVIFSQTTLSGLSGWLDVGQKPEVKKRSAAPLPPDLLTAAPRAAGLSGGKGDLMFSSAARHC